MKKTLLLGPLMGALAFVLPQEEDQVTTDEVVQDEGSEDGISQAELEALTDSIRLEIVKLRGKEFPRSVDVAIATAEEFRDYVQARLDKSTTPEEIKAQEEQAKLLGLIPADMDYLGEMMSLLEGQVGGFYDPEQEAFYLMSQFGGDAAKIILAHELTHALDDQLYDIDGTAEKREGNGDAEFAFHAVVEGSGTSVMNIWTLKNMFNLNMQEVVEAQSAGADSLEDALPFLWKPLMAAYLRGNTFLIRSTNLFETATKLPELEDFHTAFTEPPLSSEQVLHPEKYWDPTERDDPIGVTLGLDGLPEGWTVRNEDTLGELGLGLVIEPLENRKGISGASGPLSVDYTYDASKGWGGDRIALLGNETARVAVLATTWDTVEDAQEFQSALEGLREHLEAAATGTAANLGFEGSGFRVLASEEEPRNVLVLTWAGLDGDGAQGILDRVVVEFHRADDEAQATESDSTESGTTGSEGG